MGAARCSATQSDPQGVWARPLRRVPGAWGAPALARWTVRMALGALHHLVVIFRTSERETPTSLKPPGWAVRPRPPMSAQAS